MDQYSTERGLAFFYPVIICLSFICSVCSAVAWTHWKYVLDQCPETNCGCFLYGRTTYSTFEGGHVAYCHFAVYGLVLPIIFSLIFGLYHLYRVCMGRGKRRTGTTTVRQRSGEMIVVTAEADMMYHTGISAHYWIPASVISCVMSLYTLIYASIYTDGFEVSCRQYRETLLKEIRGAGNIVPVVKGRLSCAAIFDFMDYLQESDQPYRHQYGKINTGACFYITLVGAWVVVISWISISVLNITQARKSRAARV